MPKPCPDEIDDSKRGGTKMMEVCVPQVWCAIDKLRMERDHMKARIEGLENDRRGAFIVLAVILVVALIGWVR